jgi:hypothetical protein
MHAKVHHVVHCHGHCKSLLPEMKSWRATDGPSTRRSAIYPPLHTTMSPSKPKVTKPATNTPLSLEETLHDLAVIRASDIDLAAIFASTMPASTINTSNPTAADASASVVRSHEFAQAARAAIKIRNRGDVEAQGERVNDVRGQLEEVVEGLSSLSSD